MPVIPLVSIVSNLALIVQFRRQIWIEVAIWAALGKQNAKDNNSTLSYISISFL